MHLMYTLDEDGNRIYTLKVSRCLCPFTANAHLRDVSESRRFWKSHQICASRSVPHTLPMLFCRVTMPGNTARFSPDDKFSRHRVTIKKRYGVLLTQLPSKPM